MIRDPDELEASLRAYEAGEVGRRISCHLARACMRRSIGGRSRRGGGGVKYLIESWLDGATFTRTSEASYIDPRYGWSFVGAPYWLGVDTPRVFSDGSILMEVQRTNLIVDSEDLSAASWSDNATVTTDDTDAPDGGSDADRITRAGSALADRRRYDGTTAAAWLSAFIKRGVGSFVDLNRGSTSVNGIELSAVPAAWTRFVLDPAISAGSFPAVIIGWADTDNADAGDYHFFWGLQDETPSSESSYIRTSGGSGTRAGDSLSYSDPPFDPNQRIRFKVWPIHSSANFPNTRALFWSWGNGSTGRLGFDSNRIEVKNGATTESVASGLSWDARKPLTITIDKPNEKLILEGFTAGDGEYDITLATGAWPTTGTFEVGCESGAKQLHGVISLPEAA